MMSIENITQIISYLIIFVLIILIEFKRKKRIIIDFLTLFNLSFIVFYVISPILNIIYSDIISNAYSIRGNRLYVNYWYTPLLIVNSYLFFIIGYSIKLNILKNISIVPKKISKNSTNAVLIILVVSLISMLFIYSQYFGGIGQFISASVSARHLGIEPVQAGRFAFFWKIIVPSSSLLLNITYIYFYYANNKITNIKTYFFIIALINFIIVAFAQAGRGFLLFSFLELFIINCILSKKISKIFIFVTSFVLIITIIYGKPILSTIPYIINGNYELAALRFETKRNVINEKELLIGELLRYINHPTNSLKASVVETSKYNCRYFIQDLIPAVLAVFPQRLLGIDINIENQIASINSKIITNCTTTGYLPGILASFVYSFYIPGLFICSFLYGLMMKNIHTMLLDSADYAKEFIGIYLFISVYMASYTSIGYLTHLFNRNFILIIMLVLFKPIYRVYIMKKKGN